MRTKLTFRSALLVMMIIISIMARSQPSGMKLNQAIETALANNKNLRADSLGIQSAEHQIRISDAALQPKAGYYSRSEYNVAIPNQMLPGSMLGLPGKDLVPVKFGTRYSLTNGVEISQSLFNKTARLQVASAKLNSRIARTSYNLSKEELVYEVANSFYSILTTEEMIRTTASDYMNLLGIVRIAKAQFETGVLKRIDYETLEINAANKQSQLDDLITKNTEQHTYFKYLLGIPSETEITISDSVSIDSDNLTGNIAKREDLLLSRQMIALKELEVKGIHAERSAVISSYFRFNYNSQFNQISEISNSDYRYKSSVVGISVNLSLFDGNRRKNRLHAANTQLHQLKLQNDQRQLLANTEWIIANENLNSSKLRFRVTKQNLELAVKVFASRTALYAEGISTLIELLDAERELTQARNLHVQAMINLHTATINTYKSNGTLLTDFIKSIK